MASLAIIIPVFNKWEMTAACLDSLAANSPAHAFSVIVVDNGSTDKTPQRISVLGKGLFGDAFSYTRLEENINFGPACNLAAHAATEELLFFLNNDTILTPGWLSPLLEAMEKPHTAGVGPLLLYPDNAVQHLGLVIHPTGAPVEHLYRHLPASHPHVGKERTFPLATGAALMLARQKFLDAGGFYPGYRNGFEDVDLCLTLSQHGEVFRIIPQSVVYHLESQSQARHDHDMHNEKILLSRWDMAPFSNLEAVITADGYELAVDPLLNFLPQPQAGRLPQLLHRVYKGKVFQLEAAMELLDEEPYWEELYYMVATAWEAQQDWKAATLTLSRNAQFNPSYLAHYHLLSFIKRCNLLQHMPEILTAYEHIAATVVRFHKTIGDAAYEEKIKRCIERLEGQHKHHLVGKVLAAAHEANAIRSSWGQAGITG